MSLICAPALAKLFNDAMANIGNFETNPVICCGVSGGSDSLALALLLREWTEQRAGRVIALTVDHGLRPTSSDEAAAIKSKLRSLGIEQITLRWQGAKPSHGVQAAAREARYRLMAQWCQDHAILHLMTAHHWADQIETYLMRRKRGSTEFGLAGMARQRFLRNVRHSRPLLGLTRPVLRNLLVANEVTWIDDPSNDDQRFTRAQVREELRRVAPEVAQTLASEILDHARQREKLAARVAPALAHSVTLHGAGYALINLDSLLSAPADVVERGLLRIIMSLGGKEFSPRLEALRSLIRRLEGVEFKGATLGGVSFKPKGRRTAASELLVTREPRNLPAPMKIEPGKEFLWDGRFRITTAEANQLTKSTRNQRIAVLGQEGWLQAREIIASRIPYRAALSLPALWSGDDVLAVPCVEVHSADKMPSQCAISMQFAPRYNLDAA